MRVEARLKELGLVLPEPIPIPPGMQIPFVWVRVWGNRAFTAAHSPQKPNGSIAAPLGKVGAEVTAEQAYEAAALCALSMLGSLKRELGDLDRVTAWLSVLGMVNVAPGFNHIGPVMNGFSDVILEVYGPDVGRHVRAAMGVAELPFDIPVAIQAELEIEV